MISILSKVKNVKRKISEVGKKPCWLCVDSFHNQQPREDFPTSVDINLQGDPKNPVRSILTSMRDALGGVNASLGSKKLRFFPGVGGSPLLDSLYSIISRYVYITGVYR